MGHQVTMRPKQPPVIWECQQSIRNWTQYIWDHVPRGPRIDVTEQTGVPYSMAPNTFAPVSLPQLTPIVL